MKIYTLLIIDRHCDPQVMLFRKCDQAEQEAMSRAQKYWLQYTVTRDLNKQLRITQEDVGSMEVQEHEV